MKRFPLLFVTALIGLVVSVPAQRDQKERVRGANRAAVVVDRQPRADNSSASRFTGRVEAPRRGHDVRRGDHRRSTRPGGRWVTRSERVLVPGYWTTEHVPAVFGWIFDRCGNRHWGIVTPACTRRVWVPARYETQCRRVWVRH